MASMESEKSSLPNLLILWHRSFSHKFYFELHSWIMRVRKLRKFILTGPITDMHAISDKAIHIWVRHCNVLEGSIQMELHFNSKTLTLQLNTATLRTQHARLSLTVSHAGLTAQLNRSPKTTKTHYCGSQLQLVTLSHDNGNWGPSLLLCR
jgi:hypothetical protein